MSIRWVYKLCFALSTGAVLLLAGCGGVEVLDRTARDLPEEVEEGFQVVQGEPAPPLDSAVLALLRPCDGFDFPVGPPDAANYYKFRGFLPAGLEHLGEDWNGLGGGNTDFGDYVYAVADGVVFYAEDYKAGWGKVIRMVHNYGTADAPRYIESLYAHVASSWVRPGNRMKRGEIIGTIGSADGIYHAHLHFEMRKQVGKDVKSGYEGDTLGFVDPTQFIEGHRPVNGQ